MNSFCFEILSNFLGSLQNASGLFLYLKTDIRCCLAEFHACFFQERSTSRRWHTLPPRTGCTLRVRRCGCFPDSRCSYLQISAVDMLFGGKCSGAQRSDKRRKAVCADCVEFSKMTRSCPVSANAAASICCVYLLMPIRSAFGRKKWLKCHR